MGSKRGERVLGLASHTGLGKKKSLQEVKSVKIELRPTEPKALKRYRF